LFKKKIKKILKGAIISANDAVKMEIRPVNIVITPTVGL